MSPECQKGVPHDTVGTLFEHFRSPGPTGPRTPSDTSPFSGTLSGTLTGAIFARKTPVAGQGVRKSDGKVGPDRPVYPQNGDVQQVCRLQGRLAGQSLQEIEEFSPIHVREECHA